MGDADPVGVVARATGRVLLAVRLSLPPFVDLRRTTCLAHSVRTRWESDENTLSSKGPHIIKAPDMPNAKPLALGKTWLIAPLLQLLLLLLLRHALLLLRHALLLRRRLIQARRQNANACAGEGAAYLHRGYSSAHKDGDRR